MSYSSRGNRSLQHKSQILALYHASDEADKENLVIDLIDRLPAEDLSQITHDVSARMAGLALGRAFAEIFSPRRR